MEQKQSTFLLVIVISSIFLIINISVIIIFFWWNSNIFSKSNSETQVPNYLESIEWKVTSLVKETSPSVVSVIINKDLAVYRSDPWGFFRKKVGSVSKQVWWWTGFFISEDWIIITNKHVIEDRNANYTVILNDWSEYDAEVIAVNQNTDIAFLEIQDTQQEFKPLKLIKNWNVTTGQFAVAIWNALSEFQNSVSFWVVSWLDRTIEDNYTELEGLIQTDAAINPWNSGWPLLNLQWEVMWMNTAIINWSQNIGFAIELNQELIDNFLEKIKK